MTTKEDNINVNFNKLEHAEDLLACFTILAIDGPSAKLSPARIAMVRKILVDDCCGNLEFNLVKGGDPEEPCQVQTRNSLKIKLLPGGHVSFGTSTSEKCEGAECYE